MIKLTKLNGQSFTLNGLYIEQVQSFPDTTITLTNGKILVVQESELEVMNLTKTFLKEISILGSTGRGKGEHV